LHRTAYHSGKEKHTTTMCDAALCWPSPETCYTYTYKLAAAAYRTCVSWALVLPWWCLFKLNLLPLLLIYPTPTLAIEVPSAFSVFLLSVSEHPTRGHKTGTLLESFNGTVQMATSCSFLFSRLNIALSPSPPPPHPNYSDLAHQVHTRI
jgi:hypothetical protein